MKLRSFMNTKSCDTFLGLPFNIASYALLTMMVAQCTDMMVGDFVWTGGDVHLYGNHAEQVDLLLSRVPQSTPVLILNDEITDIFAFTEDDITLHNYHPLKAIPAPVAI